MQNEHTLVSKEYDRSMRRTEYIYVCSDKGCDDCYAEFQYDGSTLRVRDYWRDMVKVQNGDVVTWANIIFAHEFAGGRDPNAG